MCTVQYRIKNINACINTVTVRSYVRTYIFQKFPKESIKSFILYPTNLRTVPKYRTVQHRTSGSLNLSYGTENKGIQINTCELSGGARQYFEKNGKSQYG